MRRKNKKIDMLNGSIWDKMIVFALPLAFTGMLQQLFNAADVAVLGRFVSNESMAGVGNNVPVIGLIIAFCMGLALGANVVVARLLGMKEPERANRAVHTALATAVIFGIGAAIVGECFAGPAMDWLSVPEAVRDDALTYLRVYLLGMPFIAIYNFLAAVMRSQGDTQTPLWALVAATLVNIAGNLFFVLAFGMGTAGVIREEVRAEAPDESAAPLAGADQADFETILRERLAEAGSLSVKEITLLAGVSRQTAAKRVKRLVEAGVIEPTEARQNPRQRYRLAAKGRRAKRG